jgi:oligopeptidase A
MLQRCMTELADNPLLNVAHPIAFDAVRAEHVRPAVDALIALGTERLRALEQDSAPRSYANTMDALDAVTERLERAMTVVGHLESVATTPELREAYRQVQPLVSAFFTGITLSAPLFAQLRAYAQTPEAAQLEPTRARFLDKTVKSFEREGAALGAEDKRRLSELNVKLSEITTSFAQNVLDDTNAFELVIEDRERLRGLPERAVAAAEQSAREKGRSGYRFTLQAPSFVPVLTHLEDRAIREQIYRAFYARACHGSHDNRGLIEQVLSLRAEKARLLGFDSFVDLVLADRMAGKASRAREFVDELGQLSELAFARENRELAAFARAHGGPDALQPWDVGFWAERQRRALYDFDEEALRPYLPLPTVLSGMFELVRRLYGIVVTPAPGLSTWHQSVQVYRVSELDGSEIGIFYADLFPRESKRDGAWMNAFLTAERHSEQNEQNEQHAQRTPHVGLICANLTPPVGDGPALLGHREVETLFHEFGHLLHHLLTRVEVRGLAGTNVAWDFVELPSQIMENWCWEEQALALFARHYQTGAPLEPDLLDKMRRARTYRGANAMMRQLGFATLDLDLHVAFDPSRDGDPVQRSRNVMARFSPAPLQPDYAMITSFGHLFSHPVGYAGGYYSYKWAEVLDADAFSRFAKEGLFNADVGREFRDKILARGDSRDPMELFRDFMGREPSLEPLLRRCGIDDAEGAAAGAE